MNVKRSKIKYPINNSSFVYAPLQNGIYTLIKKISKKEKKTPGAARRFHAGRRL